MSGVDDVSGWLPVEAQDQLLEEQAKASAGVAEQLLALDARARVFVLLERAAAGSAMGGALLTIDDLKRVLESFEGVVPVDEPEIARKFSAMLEG
jgi:hypothetical protein